MNVLIIEDEKPAAQHLTTLLRRYDDNLTVLNQLDTVKKAVRWLTEQPAPDLIFMDIQLADGLSFTIFEQVTVPAPVIFTTAYDQYAIQAFKVNSVDYLLKPIDLDELSAAMQKFEKWHYSAAPATMVTTTMSQIQQAIGMLTTQYKSRFVVKVGEHIKAIPVEDILYFLSQEKMTYAQTQEGRRYIIDYSLDQVESLVDPQVFFRISRQWMVRFAAIEDVIAYSGSRLKLKLKHSSDNNVLVSRERVAAFRQWLDQ